MQFMLWYSLLLRTLYLLTAKHSIKSSRLSRLVVSADPGAHNQLHRQFPYGGKIPPQQST